MNKAGFRTLILDLKFAPHVGGTATMFKYRAQLYPPENVTVLTRLHKDSSEFDKKTAYKIIRKPFKFKGIKGFEWVTTAFLLVIACLKIFSKSKYDFIEAVRPFPEGFAVIILKFLTNKKTIINFHGEDIAVMSNYRIEKIALKLMSQYSDLLLCNSTFTHTLLQNLFPKSGSKAHIVYPGFDPIAKQTLDCERINTIRKAFNGSPILVTISRIAERKGHDMVIKVLPALLVEYPNLIYVIAGSLDAGECENSVNRLKMIATNLGIEDHIKYVMDFNDDERPYILAASDVFVMPNRTLPTGEVEGFGIVFLEASSLGLPVVGGRSGGVVDVIRNNETGILVDGNSEQEIADALKKVIGNSEYSKQLGISGVNFSSKMGYIESFKVYSSILNSKLF